MKRSRLPAPRLRTATHMLSRSLGAVALIVLLTGCVASRPQAASAPAGPGAPEVTRIATTGTPREMVNALRARNGLAPLRVSGRLSSAATAHAVDMARNDYFGHVSPNGDTERARMEAAGYDACLSRENIAWGQANDTIVTQSWMASAGHRANILDPRATDMGFGGARVDGGPRDPMWVMLIGARRC